jgi:hypothetical protein
VTYVMACVRGDLNGRASVANHSETEWELSTKCVQISTNLCLLRFVLESTRCQADGNTIRKDEYESEAD